METCQTIVCHRPRPTLTHTNTEIWTHKWEHTKRKKTFLLDKQTNFTSNVQPPLSLQTREQTTPALYRMSYISTARSDQLLGILSCSVPCHLIGLVCYDWTQWWPLWGQSNARMAQRGGRAAEKPEESLPAKHCLTRKTDEATVYIHYQHVKG